MNSAYPPVMTERSTTQTRPQDGPRLLRGGQRVRVGGQMQQRGQGGDDHQQARRDAVEHRSADDEATMAIVA